MTPANASNYPKRKARHGKGETQALISRLGRNCLLERNLKSTEMLKAAETHTLQAQTAGVRRTASVLPQLRLPEQYQDWTEGGFNVASVSTGRRTEEKKMAAAAI